MNVLFLLLTAAIIILYIHTLWRLLRSESPFALSVVTALSALALLLRLVEWSRYPGGLNDDEVTVLLHAIKALKAGALFSEGPSGLPGLIPILFQAQLVPLIGGGRWAIRLYSVIGSVLSVAATFAVARGMRMRPISSLAAAAFVAVLPWSLLYGRISQGGEVLFNQLLLLAALARLIWRDGDWREIPAGAAGLCLLFYDYFSGRSMLAMPFVGAVLARGRNRLWCLVIAIIALAGFAPQAMQGHRYAMVGLSMLQVHEDYGAHPLAILWAKLLASLAALAYPVGGIGWMTVRAGAQHPWLILGLAILGLLTGFRRALFLGAGFAVGLMPNVVAHGDLVASTHRMHAAYVFIALAAGASFDLIPWRSLRALLATVVVCFVSLWSVTYYFSQDYWYEESQWMFEYESTDLAESIPNDAPRIFEADLGNYIAIRTDLEPRIKSFAVDNQFIDGPGVYAFSARLATLRPFYETLLPPKAIKSYGRAFAISVGPWDNKWLRQHGWSYQVTCDQVTRKGQVIVLFQYFYTFAGFNCDHSVEHLWKGRWLGPPTTLRLWYGEGSVSVTTSPSETTSSSGKPSLDFSVETGAEVTIRMVGATHTLATLYVVTPRQERLPYWEWVEPLDLG